MAGLLRRLHLSRTSQGDNLAKESEESMNVYLNRITRTEVHFGNISDYWAEILDLKSANGAKAGDIVPALEMLLGTLLLQEPLDDEPIRFVRLYLEACQKYPDAEITLEPLQ